MEISQELLKQLFTYKKGFLYWKVKRPKSQIGKKAGFLNKRKSGDRYMIKINGKSYLNSRLIFLYHHNWLPEMVDHKKHNTLDDRIENLRPATRSQNLINRTSSKNSTSKYLGVSFHKLANKWCANIFIDKKLKHLGYFIIEMEAALAYNEAAKIHFGEFANLNVIM